MKLVEFSFLKQSSKDAPIWVNIFDIHELFSEYVALALPLTPYIEEAECDCKPKEIHMDETFSSDGVGLADLHFI